MADAVEYRRVYGRFGIYLNQTEISVKKRENGKGSISPVHSCKPYVVSACACAHNQDSCRDLILHSQPDARRIKRMGNSGFHSAFDRLALPFPRFLFLGKQGSRSRRLGSAHHLESAKPNHVDRIIDVCVRVVDV